jgi:hypothetical protein
VSQLNTALSNTTLSGYVDVGAQYVNATGAAYSTVGAGDSFSLNTVDIALDKPLDSTPFSAGYHIELWTGQGTTVTTPTGTAAVASSPAPLGTGSLIRQAYLALGTTIGGQEIDWKIGVWDTIIGYEGLTSSANPNYTHSYGFFVEPTTHTGVQGTYKINDMVTVQAAVADDSYTGGFYSAAINGVPGKGGTLHHPTLMGDVALTAPDSFGALKGATLTIGGINTADPAGGFGDSVYVGASIPTSNSALSFGGAFDYADGALGGVSGHVWVGGLYGQYKASDKLTFNVRGEVFGETQAIIENSAHGEELTATASYALWANVLSRVEVRWDHAENNAVFANNANGGLEKNAIILAAQLIYTF